MKVTTGSPEQTWNVLTIVAFVLLMASGYLVAFPIQPPKVDLKKASNDAAKLKDENVQLAQAIAGEEARLDQALWTGKLDELSPSALGRVSEVARQSGVVVTAFRPQRAVEDTAVAQYPLLITCEGRYQAMLEFVRRLELSEAKLAVNLVQLSAADGATDQVTASIGVVAFYAVPKPPPVTRPRSRAAASRKEVAGG